MTANREHAAVVALLRTGRRRPREYVQLLEQAGSALAVLEAELGGSDSAQTTLLPESPEPVLKHAAAELAQWHADGFEVVTVLDDGYPPNLRKVHDRPALLFIAGRLAAEDERSIAVIGARHASEAGLELGAAFASDLVRNGWVVASGLAAGIDASAHRAALDHGGRTLAVIGTGLRQSYPPENARLQHTIAERCVVISQFWPESPPARESFPMRNAVMSGISRGSVVIEASERSGARVQTRLALAHGRPVFLHQRLTVQGWAADLAGQPHVYVVTSAADVLAVLERSPTRSSWPP
jgi:DNA processing protein